MPTSSLQHILSFLLWNLSSTILLKELCIVYKKWEGKWCSKWSACCWISGLENANRLGPRLDFKQKQALIHGLFTNPSTDVWRYRKDIGYYINILRYISTLGAEMFGVGDFWLETRLIIKISTHPLYPRIVD